MALVLDTGVLYATLDDSDRDHLVCEALILSTSEELILPEPVLVELDYWLRKMASADVWLAFSEDVARGSYSLFPVTNELLVRAAQLEVEYADLRLGFVDAAVFATCERLGETKVATLDRRHFGTIRTNDGRSLEILP